MHALVKSCSNPELWPKSGTDKYFCKKFFILMLVLVIWGLVWILAKRASGQHTGRSRSYPRPSQRDDRCAPWKWTPLLSSPNTNSSSCKQLVPTSGQLILLYWYHCSSWCLALTWLQRQLTVLLEFREELINFNDFLRLLGVKTDLLWYTTIQHTGKTYAVPTSKICMTQINKLWKKHSVLKENFVNEAQNQDQNKLKTNI